MSDTMQDADEKVDTYRGEPGDHEKFSHYIPKVALDKAIMLGEEATALCGKKWLPTRDPERFPVCPKCKALWELKNDA